MSRTAILFAAVIVGAIGFVGCGGEPRQGLARGAELYDTCRPCHGTRGEGNVVVGAPAIAGLPRWYVEAQLDKFKKGIRGAHPDDAHGALMRPMARTLNHEGDAGSVAEYVEKMPGTHAAATLGGDPAAGATRYNGVCIACHLLIGKRLASVALMSGGEKSMAALALLFAIFRIQPSPFCLLDEVDAALDELNVNRFTRMLQEYARNTQFILITHNKRSMESANLLYGVTMEEPGVSRLVSMRV